MLLLYIVRVVENKYYFLSDRCCFNQSHTYNFYDVGSSKEVRERALLLSRTTVRNLMAAFLL